MSSTHYFDQRIQTKSNVSQGHISNIRQQEPHKSEPRREILARTKLIGSGRSRIRSFNFNSAAHAHRNKWCFKFARMNSGKPLTSALFVAGAFIPVSYKSCTKNRLPHFASSQPFLVRICPAPPISSQSGFRPQAGTAWRLRFRGSCSQAGCPSQSDGAGMLFRTFSDQA